MDQETINLVDRYCRLDNHVFKAMTIQELFDLRHDMLNLKHKLAELLDQ